MSEKNNKMSKDFERINNATDVAHFGCRGCGSLFILYIQIGIVLFLALI